VVRKLISKLGCVLCSSLYDSRDWAKSQENVRMCFAVLRKNKGGVA
jgi:hypothetical protein